PEALALHARIRQAVERAAPRKPRDTRARTRTRVSDAEAIVARPAEPSDSKPAPPSSPPERGRETPRSDGKTPQGSPRAATGRPRGQRKTHDESDLLD
ncbi:MAG: hypothetical protein ACRD1U_09420, partial [Vicinamibacterales bacterium]